MQIRPKDKLLQGGPIDSPGILLSMREEMTLMIA
jgi:hypothetical protein